MARVALVTGGTRGIGAAISVALRQQGRTVVAVYAGNEKSATAFHEETGIRTMRFDVASFEACQKAVAEIASAKNSRWAYCDRCLNQTKRWMTPSVRLAADIMIQATWTQFISSQRRKVRLPREPTCLRCSPRC